MDIRPATGKDLPVLIQMGADFYSQTNNPVPFDFESFARTLLNMIEGEGGALFVAERQVGGGIKGMAGAVAFPSYVNMNVLVAQELFLWVDEDARKSSAGVRLFKALEAWARDMGAHSMLASSQEKIQPERMARFYTKQGYQPTDHGFAKVLAA